MPAAGPEQFNGVTRLQPVVLGEVLFHRDGTMCWKVAGTQRQLRHRRLGLNGDADSTAVKGVPVDADTHIALLAKFDYRIAGEPLRGVAQSKCAGAGDDCVGQQLYGVCPIH